MAGEEGGREAAWVRLGLELGAALAQIVVRAIQAGDVSTLDALASILPGPALLAARDEALRIAQRGRAAAALRPSRGTP